MSAGMSQARVRQPNVTTFEAKAPTLVSRASAHGAAVVLLGGSGERAEARAERMLRRRGPAVAHKCRSPPAELKLPV